MIHTRTTESKSTLKWGTGHNSFLEKATTDRKPIVSVRKPEESNENSLNYGSDADNVVLCVLSECGGLLSGAC